MDSNLNSSQHPCLAVSPTTTRSANKSKPAHYLAEVAVVEVPAFSEEPRDRKVRAACLGVKPPHSSSNPNKILVRDSLDRVLLLNHSSRRAFSVRANLRDKVYLDRPPLQHRQAADSLAAANLSKRVSTHCLKIVNMITNHQFLTSPLPQHPSLDNLQQANQVAFSPSLNQLNNHCGVSHSSKTSNRQQIKAYSALRTLNKLSLASAALHHSSRGNLNQINLAKTSLVPHPVFLRATHSRWLPPECTLRYPLAHLSSNVRRSSGSSTKTRSSCSFRITVGRWLWIPLAITTPTSL